MARLLVLQGLPASGKSTYARELLDAYPEGQVVRVNNDDLTEAMFGSAFVRSSDISNMLSRVRSEIIRQAFANHAELVVVDNTNLNPNTVKSLHRLAEKLGVEFEIDDRFLSVSVEECLRRNAFRENAVPDGVIYDMARLLVK
jgi:predicted kinase